MNVQTTSPPSSLTPRIPPSRSIVSTSIIDTTTRLSKITSSFLLKPILPFTAQYWSGPSWSFLIRHPTKGSLLFDMGIRKDWNAGLPPAIQIMEHGWKVHVEKDVPDILADHGVKLSDIDAMVISHHHWDHIGDPSRFPPSTRLIVGPGFKGEYLPGYPADPEGVIVESVYAGREMQELNFNNDDRACAIGGFQALDWFHDGSFYVLNSPGHTVGHICGLARTTLSDSDTDGSFILLGGDIAHHGGEHRPSPYHLLPELFSAAHSGLPLSRSSPFYQSAYAHNPKDAEESMQKLINLEADERIWVVTAHDPSLMEENVGIELFPKEANDWKAKGWKEKTFWKFLEAC